MMTAKKLTDASLNPLTHAREALEKASLGRSAVDGTNNYLLALVELGNAEGLADKHLRKRINVIRGLAEMGVRFAEDMDDLMESAEIDAEEAIAAVIAAQKGGK